MEKVIHRASERGKGDYDWLTTRYSFSFADWYEPTRMGFGALRVINDDVIVPSSGFGIHSHKDMEIITIVTKGTVTHEDSIGNKGTVPAGDVQVMSAGTGVTHSEYNRSQDEPLALFQIWITPDTKNVAPRYAQKSFGIEKKGNGATLLVSPDGTDGSLSIHQDAYLSHVVLDSTHPFSYEIKKEGNGAYVFVLDGEVTIDGVPLSPRDALGITGTDTFALTTPARATALVIEVPL